MIVLSVMKGLKGIWMFCSELVFLGGVMLGVGCVCCWCWVSKSMGMLIIVFSNDVRKMMIGSVF